MAEVPDFNNNNFVPPETVETILKKARDRDPLS